MKKINQAIILTAGEGTRLRPYTEIIPKAMLPVNGKPIIRWTLEHLKKYHIEEIIVCTNKKFGSMLHDYIDDGARFGLRVSYSVSEKPLGTLGEVLNCKSKLKERFILYYGDQITSLNIRHMIKLHIKKNAMATLALSSNVHSDYGIVHINHSKEIIDFKEKPLIEGAVWTGIAIIEKLLLTSAKGHDFAHDVFTNAIRKNKLVGYLTNAFWADIGSISHFEKVNQLMKNNKIV